MNKIEKFDLMEKIVRELEDFKNSAQALLEKAAKIEVDNIELGDKKLEQSMPDVHQSLADSLSHVQGILDSFAEQTEQFGEKNNIEALKEQEAINAVSGK